MEIGSTFGIMKKSVLFSFLCAAFALAACSDPSDQIRSEGDSQTLGVDAVDSGKLPVFAFEEESFDFGTIEEGVVATHDFTFTNTGEVPLVISAANGSCGCTVPEFPRTPIAPGATGVINVSFDSNKRAGKQEKTVTLTANTVPNVHVLKITAEVNPKS
jgi:hypothetical protein